MVVRQSGLLFLFIVSCGPLSSQTDTLSLREAIELAQQRNLRIAVSELASKQSESHLREVRSSRYPPLLFRSHYLYAPEPGYNDAVTNGGEYALQLGSGIPLYDGGVRSATIGQAENDLERSGIDVAKSRVDIAYAVRTVYYEILRATDDLRIRRETVERLTDYLALLRQLRLGGVATESDVLKAQVDLNNSLIDDAESENALRRARLGLNNVIGMHTGDSVEVREPGPADSAAEPEFNTEDNLDLRLLQRERTSATFDVTIARAERLPSVTIAGDIGVLGVQPNNFRHDAGYSVLLTLELPLFTWGAVGDRIEQKEYAEQRLEAEVNLERRNLETEWQGAVNDLALARQNLVSTASNILDAERNYLAARSRFAGGSGSNLDVLDAQRLLVEAKLNHNTTLFRMRSALAVMLRLSGQS